MNNTHDVIIELIQKETFKQELQDLFSSSEVNQNSILVTLSPILNNNIIKVGGRLKDIIGTPNQLNIKLYYQDTTLLQIYQYYITTNQIITVEEIRH